MCKDKNMTRIKVVFLIVTDGVEDRTLNKIKVTIFS